MSYIQTADLVNGAFMNLATPGMPAVDFSQYQSGQLQALIQRAQTQIDGHCKQTFALTNVQERYVGHGTNKMALRKYPLAQIPDSVLGGPGNVSQSLVCDTQFDQAITQAQITAGINQVHVLDISNMLPGQYLVWGDGTNEPGFEITTITPDTAGATSGPGFVRVANNLTVPHPTTPVTQGFKPRLVVNTIDFIQIVLPGQAMFPIPANQLVVDARKGILMNYTPLMFQNLGYATIFPNMLPLLVRYTYGFMAGQVPDVLREVCAEQCRRIILLNSHPGQTGIQSVKSGDAAIHFAPWKPVLLGEDLRSELGPFRRNVGFA